MSAPLEVLLLHDGELADVAALLGALDVEWMEARAGQVVQGAAPLVIGTPSRLLRMRAPSDPDGMARIAICEAGARNLDKRLEAEGIDFVLRRPVHPAALRLVVLHMIYRGPERRRLRRVNATVPVRYRAGWSKRTGLLMEFSVGGCSLLVDRPFEAGARLKLFMPEQLGLGRKLTIKAVVVRRLPAPSGKKGEFVVALDFGELDPEVHQRLAAAVVARARQAVGTVDAARSSSEPGRGSDDVDDRRQMPRGRYTKAVHGRVENQQVVLMGSNLSPLGMHVDREPHLAMGRRLKLDLYGHGDIPPLRLEARVARDDGDAGFYLEFVDLWPGAPALIERLIKTLPLASPGAPGMVISEVIESGTLGRDR